jgi:hypothetical protein
VEHATNEPMAGAWFLAAVAESEDCLPEPEAGTSPQMIIPDVIISVSLDELDGLSGDMLV